MNWGSPTKSTGQRGSSTVAPFGRFLGAQNRAEPHGSRQKRLETSPLNGCERCSARLRTDRGERARFRNGHGACRRDRPHQATVRSAPKTTGGSPGGSSLRCRRKNPRAAAKTRDQTHHRQTEYRTWKRPRQIPLCGRGSVFLALQTATSPGSLRETR